MKKILMSIAAMAFVLVGCNKGFEDRLTDLENRVSALEEYVTNLNNEVSGIQTIVTTLQSKVYVTGVEAVKNDSGAETGFKITFNQGNPIIINHGKTGDQGQTGTPGLTPGIDMFDTDNDGKPDTWYWRYVGGDWILDGSGNKIPVSKSLSFEVDNEGNLYVSVDGAPVEKIGNVQGPQGDSWFDGVTVDEEAGTVTISITGSEHDLVLPFNAAAADDFALELQLPASTDVLLGGTIEISYTLAGCPADAAAVFVQAPEDWTVALDETNKKINLKVGEKSGRVVVYAVNNETGEIKAKFVNYDREKMFVIGADKSEFYLSPAGDKLTIPVSTGISYKIDESYDWLDVVKTTKAVENTEITFEAAANTTGKERNGDVNLWTTDGQTLLFTVKVSQKSVIRELLWDENGDPVKWQETFDLKSGSTTTAKKNDVTIELSDDYSKGTYLIKNMFVADGYFNADMQLVSNQGADYYADEENGVLTVYKGSQKSYAFEDNIALTIDLSALTLTAPTSISCRTMPPTPTDVTILDYKIAIPAPEQEGGDDEGNTGSITGTFTATVGFKSNGTPSTKTETITISENTDGNGQYKITGMFDQYGNGGGTYYANYADGVLTILAANADNMYIGSMSGDIKMAHNGIAFASEQGVTAGSYGYVLTDYMAYPENITAGIVGTYKATVGFKSNGTPSTKTETITISENTDGNGQYKITGMFDQYGNGGGTYYANYADGVLTILAANADNMYIGSMSGDIKMNLSTLVFASSAGFTAGSYGYVLTSYVAK